MSELVEEWSAQKKENIFGSVPTAIEMQSEAGVAGCMHGALQTGSLSSTFTASQGLLLMMPNMFKIAGELTPNVIHVATRSVATHALSVFGDHSDIMAVRSTGYAFLGGASVQEAQDFALIAQAASLQSRVPFVHFFDGFRTSHEIAKIAPIANSTVEKMIAKNLVRAHGKRALNPNNPIIRGTAQGPDVFFQSREASNRFYLECPNIVQRQMDKFAQFTGRTYRLFDYVGHPKAEHIIVAMGSAAETIEQTVNFMNGQGMRVGLVKVRLFRPFSTKHLMDVLPASCKSIAVLDRTKEPGATGEALYLDIVQAVMESAERFESVPHVVGGRYGLSSKEFNPSMVMAIFDNLTLDSPKNNFTAGITDDITHLSLPVVKEIQLPAADFEILIYEAKSEASGSSKNGLLHILGNTYHVQGYTEIDYKKSGARSVANIRLATRPIKAPYLISNANMVLCDSVTFLNNDNALERVADKGTLLVNTTISRNEFWNELSVKAQQIIHSKQIALYTVDLDAISSSYQMVDELLTGLHSCALALYNGVPNIDLSHIRRHINKIDPIAPLVRDKNRFGKDAEFGESLIGKLIAGKGNELPVGALPFDGTYPTDTARVHSRTGAAYLPEWDTDLCTQCGACSMACPQGAIQLKTFLPANLENAPTSFQFTIAADYLERPNDELYSLAINPDNCTSCNICVDACDSSALYLTHTNGAKSKQRWNHFETIPYANREGLDIVKVAQQQLQEPLFINPYGVDGCGEAPYLKLLSQLFGDRMLVANATGASSIFGGALPTTPWSKNDSGRGVAWSNSLFEDNAEFGLGFRLSVNKKRRQALSLLKGLVDHVGSQLVRDIVEAEQDSEARIIAQREKVDRLKNVLGAIATPEANELINLADYLVNQSVWIVGGDGWAYDIGFGGLDHVLASGENVNILVLDNEAYSNTGGQMSKATPLGAMAKFAHASKMTRKKDLGRMAMTYEGVYVASVAIGADQEQTLRAFVEAERYNGPSLIIAYCHSPAHGIDMESPRQHHKAAVASGRWLLYRNNPSRMEQGLNPFQLDSAKPSLPLESYFRLEKRYKKALDMSSDSLKEIEEDYERRYMQLLGRTQNREKLEYEPLNYK